MKYEPELAADVDRILHSVTELPVQTVYICFDGNASWYMNSIIHLKYVIIPKLGAKNIDC